eukprot:9470913-Pyramimonas_sp.AAC.2
MLNSRSKHKFGILTHPSEAKKVQNTGYLSHLCLINSVYTEGVLHFHERNIESTLTILPLLLVLSSTHHIASNESVRSALATCLVSGEGTDFTHDAAVRAALEDPDRRSFLVYPDEDAADLTSMSDEEVFEQFGEGAMFWIVDGSWSTARKMVYKSKILRNLPKVAFTPEQRSQFRIRRQPKDFCYSTIEAIHYILKRNYDAEVATAEATNSETRGLSPKKYPFDNLLRVFNRMVELQISAKSARVDSLPTRYSRLSLAKTPGSIVMGKRLSHSILLIYPLVYDTKNGVAIHCLSSFIFAQHEAVKVIE